MRASLVDLLPIRQQRTNNVPIVLSAFCAGAAFGAAFMYALDPQMGRRRRALVRDQMAHSASQFDDLRVAARGRAQDIRNRAQGSAIETGVITP